MSLFVRARAPTRLHRCDTQKAYGCMRKTENACMHTNVHVISWVLGAKMLLLNSVFWQLSKTGLCAMDGAVRAYILHVGDARGTGQQIAACGRSECL